METATETPQRSPARRVPALTQGQKQALIDNLQQEITSRALRLRGEYAQQSRALRSRLEMRVNRIPQALRKRNIQELIDEHHAKSKPAPPPPAMVAPKVQAVQVAQTQPARTVKRKSDEISVENDKENVPAHIAQDLSNPKKRVKTAVTANSKAMRARNAGPAGILSPKSHNSRTLPQSPIKPAEKSAPPRPMSSAQSAVAKPTRAPSRQAKRPGTAPDTDGRASEASNTSAGTTIVTKSGTRKAATATTKTASAKGSSATRKPAVAKVEPAAATRTLRKRN